MFTKLSHAVKLRHMQKLAVAEFDAVSLAQENLARDSINNPHNLNSNLYVIDKLNEGVGKGVQHANTYLLKGKIPFLGKVVDAISDLRQENPDLLPQIPDEGLYKEKTIGMPAIANTEKSIKPTLRSYISPEKANMYDDIAGLLLAATGLGGATALSKARLKPRSRFF